MSDTKARKAKNNKMGETKNHLRKEILSDESPVGSLKKAEALFKRYRDMGISRLALRQATFDVDETTASIKQISSLIKG